MQTDKNVLKTYIDTDKEVRYENGKNIISYIVLVFVEYTIIPDVLSAQIPSNIPDALTIIHSRSALYRI